MPTYLQGLTIGLAYVAPIGMQNLFVINSALTQPRRRALLTALIVIAFDISLALACFFGIGALVERFDWLQRLILIVGGCIVVWIGIGLLRDKPTLDRDVDVSIPLPRLAAKAFVVTWINPQALIDGTMLFGSFRAGNPGAVASQLMLGSASASCLWFLGITILGSFFSAKFNDKILRVINVVCGLIIIFYGAKLLLQFFQTLLDKFLAFIIQSTRCLIQNQDRWILQKYSCNRNALFLTAGQSGSSLTNECLIPIRKPHDEFMNISLLCRLNNLFH